MLSIPGISGSTCDGFSRRELLRVGGCGLFGLSLSETGLEQLFFLFDLFNALFGFGQFLGVYGGGTCA